jgi:hypothetical protein
MVGCVLMLTVLCSALAMSAASADLKISGYTQARFLDTETEGSDYDFDLRRVRLKVAGPVNDDGTAIKLQIDLGKLDDDGDVVLKDATITHPLGDEWKVRVGFSDMMFGEDVGYSSSKRLPFERAKVTRSLFPGEKDTGIYFFYKPSDKESHMPHVTVGYSDDLEKMDDKLFTGGDVHDDSEALVASVKWPLRNKGAAGLSYMRASRDGFDAGGAPLGYDDDVWAAHVRYNGSKRFSFQGEYFNGSRKEVNVDGWYGTVEYTPKESKTTWFYRYDIYDDGDADDYKRHTLGAAHTLGERSRLTLQYEDIDDEGTTGSTLGLQWQVKY